MGITEEEKQLLDYLGLAFSQEAVALVETTKTDGSRALVICLVRETPEGVDMHPYAQVITDDMFGQYNPPEGSNAMSDAPIEPVESTTSA